MFLHQMLNDGIKWSESDSARYANGRPRSKNALQRARERSVDVQLDARSTQDELF